MTQRRMHAGACGKNAHSQQRYHRCAPVSSPPHPARSHRRHSPPPGRTSARVRAGPGGCPGPPFACVINSATKHLHAPRACLLMLIIIGARARVRAHPVFGCNMWPVSVVWCALAARPERWGGAKLSECVRARSRARAKPDHSDILHNERAPRS